MTKLVRGPVHEVRSRVFDSARWADYKPRADDIVIATYPKCGTTWTQRIVSMLVFKSAAPAAIQDLSPWPDMRMFGPIEQVLAEAEAQTHRRYLKSHLPYDALPVYEGVKFVHVARDGRDAAMSFHNHMHNFTQASLERFSEVTLADPKFATRFDPVSGDPAAYFHDWVCADDDALGDPRASYFYVENSYWAARNDPNMLLVHYNDLKKDRGGEMRRIAAFLEIDIPETLWPDLIAAAAFDAMKSQADELLPHADQVWEGGANRFLHKGTNGRWQDVCDAADLARYEAKLAAACTPDLAHWLTHGRLASA